MQVCVCVCVCACASRVCAMCVPWLTRICAVHNACAMDVLASACQCVLVLTWITGSDEERFPDPCDDQTTYLLLILSHLSAERAGQAGMKREVVSNVRLRGIAGVQLPVWRFFAWSYVCAILNVHALCIMHAHRVCIQSVATCIPGQLAVTKNVSLIPVMIKRRTSYSY